MNLGGQRVERPGLGDPLSQYLDREDDMAADDTALGRARSCRGALSLLRLLLGLFAAGCELAGRFRGIWQQKSLIFESVANSK